MTEAACQYCDEYDLKCPGRGLCHCGCGKPTLLRKTTSLQLNLRKGDPNKFLAKHIANRWRDPSKQKTGDSA